jgi:hypothetical protein
MDTWMQQRQDQAHYLRTLEEPPITGRLLPTGGFILADSFDTFLRGISGAYLATLWGNLEPVLDTAGFNPRDLTWGMLHAGNTWLDNKPAPTPLDYLGLLSPGLERFDQALYDGKGAGSAIATLDQHLQQMTPALRCASCWRSSRWRIAPNDYTTALLLIEDVCTDEISNWYPPFIVETSGPHPAPWQQIAHALVHSDASALDAAVRTARESYSPIGFRIVWQGYARFLNHGVHVTDLRLPLLELAG